MRIQDEHLNLHGLETVINGDNVVGVVSPAYAQTKIGGWADMQQLDAFCKHMDKMKGDTKKHLGRIELFATSGLVQKTTGADLVKSDAVLELDTNRGENIVSYEIAVPSSDTDGFMVVQDSDLQNGTEPIGVDGAPFYVYLDKAPTTVDFLKFDLESEFQVKVSDEMDAVTQEGDKYKVYFVFDTPNKKKDFPKYGLKAGTKYFKVAHPMAEYETKWSTVNTGLSNPGYIELEWRLGSPHGVEAYWTKEAGNFMVDSMIANKVGEKLNQDISKISGRGERKTLFVTGRYNASNKSIGYTHVSTIMEVLVMAEAYRIEAYSNMFASAHYEANRGGFVHINEGAWLQARRGKIITYPRPNALGIAQLSEAANYYYKNSDIPLDQRTTIFRGGQMAIQQVQNIINNYGTQILNNIPTALIGTGSLIKDKGLVTGSLDNLRVNNPNIGSVMVPGIGRMECIHDSSFDHSLNTTGNTMRDGFYGLGGFNKLSYSLIVDGVSPNPALDKLRNASVVNNGNRNSNLYYIMPKVGHVTSGTEQGRMNNGNQYTGVTSSAKYRGQAFWAEIQSGMLMLDVTKNIIIELDNEFLK